MTVSDRTRAKVEALILGRTAPDAAANLIDAQLVTDETTDASLTALETWRSRALEAEKKEAQMRQFAENLLVEAEAAGQSLTTGETRRMRSVAQYLKDIAAGNEGKL